MKVIFAMENGHVLLVKMKSHVQHVETIPNMFNVQANWKWKTLNKSAFHKNTYAMV